MQISTSQLYDRSTSLMQKLSQKADSLQNQISSTVKFTAPSDDVVAYQRLAGLKQGKADDVAAGANVTLAQSLLQQSDTTLTAIQNGLQNAAELVLQANNDTLTDANRATIATQLTSVLDDLVSLANTRDARGQPLFGAATGDSAVTVATDGSVSFSGTGTPPAIPIGDGQEIAATDSAARVFGGIATASGTSDAFAIISKFAAALNAGGNVSAAAKEAGDGINAALTQVTSVQGSVGARAARLDMVSSQLTDTATNREIDRGALEDTDVTAALTELQKTMTILSATQASFTKLSQLSLFDYLR
ncbi:MAG: Flagellar hook-associated protein FlgL [Sphingomonas bacterium]|uniref:flagellin N-terminal helical domain-containing protein n=1 Tax=Sphingomonas bacterium TaxID=1895847 RepID=UPI00262925C8|nr:flagellin [Sphingomonas bacterium]MDB5703475.1 Flagellar hook-associated protein FlgL [Sphingomonas bacterium]